VPEKIDERVKIGLRVHPAEFGQHAFPAAPRNEPVVNQGDFHPVPINRRARLGNGSDRAGACRILRDWRSRPGTLNVDVD
jgi:hypothetical protein